MKTKSLPEVYRVVNMDIYNVDLKTHHIAQKVTVPKPSKAVIENAERLGFPAQLILNFMVPHYPVKPPPPPKVLPLSCIQFSSPAPRFLALPCPHSFTTRMQR